eukprot:663189-Prymnesium_polylepis.1
MNAPFSSSTSRSAGSSALTKKPAASVSTSVCLSAPETPAAALEPPAAAPEQRALEPAPGAQSSRCWPPPSGQFSHLRLLGWQPGPQCAHSCLLYTSPSPRDAHDL